MAHWRAVLPAGAMLDVSYEEVVDNLEQQARRLIDFCGLPWDDRCLSFHETEPADRDLQQRSSPPAALPQLTCALAPLRSLSPAAAGRARELPQVEMRAGPKKLIVIGPALTFRPRAIASVVHRLRSG